MPATGNPRSLLPHGFSSGGLPCLLNRRLQRLGRGNADRSLVRQNPHQRLTMLRRKKLDHDAISLQALERSPAGTYAESIPDALFDGYLSLGTYQCAHMYTSDAWYDRL